MLCAGLGVVFKIAVFGSELPLFFGNLKAFFFKGPTEG
jgi:hypothetical protein